MPQVMVNDMDYLTARLHGRRSRLAEAERLDAFCGLADLSALYDAIHPGTEFHATADFQRRLIQDLVREVSSFLKNLEGTGADLLTWMLVRFQVENVKVLLRRFIHRTPSETPDEHLLSLPRDLALDVKALMAAKSLEEFAERLPFGAPRARLRKALQIYHDRPRLFFLEAALALGFFQELLARTERLSDDDKELTKPVVLQEADAFHLLLVARGKFYYGVSASLLLPLHIRWTGIPMGRFNAMLAATDIISVARLAVGRAIDGLPDERESGEALASVDSAVLEALAWKRYLRLSNRAFRRSHMGLGAVVGYFGIRRVEVANLITLSEGIRMRAGAVAIGKRLVPRTGLELLYV